MIGVCVPAPDHLPAEFTPCVEGVNSRFQPGVGTNGPMGNVRRRYEEDPGCLMRAVAFRRRPRTVRSRRG